MKFFHNKKDKTRKDEKPLSEVFQEALWEIREWISKEVFNKTSGMSGHLTIILCEFGGIRGVRTATGGASVHHLNGKFRIDMNLLQDLLDKKPVNIELRKDGMLEAYIETLRGKQDEFEFEGTLVNTQVQEVKK